MFFFWLACDHLSLVVIVDTIPQDLDSLFQIQKGAKISAGNDSQRSCGSGWSQISYFWPCNACLFCWSVCVRVEIWHLECALEQERGCAPLLDTKFESCWSVKAFSGVLRATAHLSVWASWELTLDLKSYPNAVEWYPVYNLNLIQQI